MGLGFPKRGRHYKKSALWKRIIKWTLISTLAIVLTVGLAGFIFVYHTLGKIGVDTEVIYEAKQQLDIVMPDEPRNILVMGTDSDPDGTAKRSDSIMLVRVNPNGECMSILSIPRDLDVDVPGVGITKINAAYATGGTPLAIETVRNLTGLPIHHFVLVDYTGFEQAVDAMGGVYVDVDKRYFNDNSDVPWGEEYEPIDVWPGYQKLNGKDALAYVRYRHTDSDFMRIARQQYFIRDVKAQSLQWGNITKIPELADVFASNTTSDIGRSDVLSLTKFVLTVGRDRIHQAQVPVVESGGQVILSREDLADVIDQFQSPSFSEPNPTVPGVAPVEVPAAKTKAMTIEVYNGSDIEGAAALTAQLLQQKGCASVTIGGNYTASGTQNQVYFSGGNQQAAEELATLLKPSQVAPIPADLPAKAQLVIVLGNDFAGELTEKKPEAAAAVLHFADDPEEGRMRWQAAKLQLPFPAQKPMSFPVEFTYEDFHVYEIDTDEGPKPALKVVGNSENGQAWGIMETPFISAPLLQQPSVERDINGKTYRFFYVEDNLRYLSWQDGNVVFWISNSLQNSLSEETMVQLAVSFKPV